MVFWRRAYLLSYGKMVRAGQNLHFWGLGNRFKVDSGQKCAEKDPICSRRQPASEIRDFPGHLKSANPDFYDFRGKSTDVLRFGIKTVDFL